MIVLLDSPFRSRINHKEVTEAVFYIKELTDIEIEFETIVEQRQRKVNDFELDTIRIRLERFKPLKEAPKLIRIEFASGNCYYGGCPQQNILIDSTGLYYYEPVANVKINTIYESRDAKKLFDEMSVIASSISQNEYQFDEGITMHQQVLHTKLIFNNGTEVSKFSDYNSVLFPIQSKLIHSLDFVENLKEAKPLKFGIRDTLNNHPL